MDITDAMLWWDSTDQQFVDEMETRQALADHWDYRNPNGGNAELCGDPNTDLVTLIENHFGEFAHKILTTWANTFWSLLDQYGAQGAFEFILNSETPSNT